MQHVIALMNFNQNTPQAGWGVIAVVVACLYALSRVRGGSGS